MIISKTNPIFVRLPQDVQSALCSLTEKSNDELSDLIVRYESLDEWRTSAEAQAEIDFVIDAVSAEMTRRENSVFEDSPVFARLDDDTKSLFRASRVLTDEAIDKILSDASNFDGVDISPDHREELDFIMDFFFKEVVRRSDDDIILEGGRP